MRVSLSRLIAAVSIAVCLLSFGAYVSSCATAASTVTKCAPTVTPDLLALVSSALGDQASPDAYVSDLEDLAVRLGLCTGVIDSAVAQVIADLQKQATGAQVDPLAAVKIARGKEWLAKHSLQADRSPVYWRLGEYRAWLSLNGVTVREPPRAEPC
jgi:hypothetical protein